MLNNSPAIANTPVQTSILNQNLKQIFKNTQITLYVTSNKVDKMTSDLIFNISNNVNQPISNLKLMFSVPKYMHRNINSPTGNSLLPQAQLGIQQVKHFKLN